MKEKDAISSSYLPESPSGLTPTTTICEYLSEDDNYGGFSDSDVDLVGMLYSFSCKDYS